MGQTEELQQSICHLFNKICLIAYFTWDSNNDLTSSFVSFLNNSFAISSNKNAKFSVNFSNSSAKKFFGLLRDKTNFQQNLIAFLSKEKFNNCYLINRVYEIIGYQNKQS